MATEYVAGLNQHRFGQMLDNLHNDFRIGRDEYPKDLTSEYDLVINQKGDKRPNHITPNYGMAFIQQVEEEGDVHANSDQKVQMIRASKPVERHICGANHYANECPQRCQPEPIETQKASVNATMGNTD